MALIQWSDQLSVQVQEIDGQHQRLVKMINDLDAAMRVGKGKDVLGKIVSDLIAYTQVHFGTEEKLFGQYGYPDAQAHQAEHRHFIEEVSRFKGEFDAGRLGLSLKVMDFLSDWLSHHIMGVDQKYAPFFKEKGLH